MFRNVFALIVEVKFRAVINSVSIVVQSKNKNIKHLRVFLFLSILIDLMITNVIYLNYDKAYCCCGWQSKCWEINIF